MTNKEIALRWWNQLTGYLQDKYLNIMPAEFGVRDYKNRKIDDYIETVWFEEMKKFDENDWEFERSSGYAGYRNLTNDREWIFQEDYHARRRAKAEHDLWEEQVFRIIKLHTRSNEMTEDIVKQLKEKIIISSK